MVTPRCRIGVHAIPLFAALPAAGCAQRPATPLEADVHIDHQMSQPMGEGAHLALTPTRRPTHADSARAAAIADTLRRAIAKYADVHLAEAEGFRRFAPRIKNQTVFHYTLRSSALRATIQFDPARPTSLLYRRQADGSLKLVGAMYTAPGRASLDELDRRVPLSMARWHLHVNICVPQLGERDRWRESRDGHPLFGPASPITTREACDAVGGRFLPRLFGWMVHADVLASDDPATIWAAPHNHERPS